MGVQAVIPAFDPKYATNYQPQLVNFTVTGEAAGQQIALAPRACYVRTGDVSMPMQVDAIVHVDPIISEHTLEEIQAGLKPPPLTVTPAFSRVGASFLVRL